MRLCSSDYASMLNLERSPVNQNVAFLLSSLSFAGSMLPCGQDVTQNSQPVEFGI